MSETNKRIDKDINSDSKVRTLTGFEIHRLLEESRKDLEGGRIDKIFHSKNELLIRIRKREEDNKVIKTSIFFHIPIYFKIKSGYEIFNKENSNFGAALRKKLNNRIIDSVNQVGYDRIIEFIFNNLERKENRVKQTKLIIEMFNKGRIILTENNKIVLKYSLRKEKDNNFGEEYKLPDKTIKEPNPEEVSQSKVEKEIVKVLASYYGFGRVYAEEICRRAGINKLKQANKLNKDEREHLRRTIKKILEEKKALCYSINDKKEISCVELKTIENKPKECSKLSDAVEWMYQELDTNISNVKGKVYNRKKTKEEIIIKKQKENIEKLKQEMEQSRETAERIYENYAVIKAVLEKAQQILKENTNNKEKRKRVLEMNHELEAKTNIKIKDINFKEKALILEIKQ